MRAKGPRTVAELGPPPRLSVSAAVRARPYIVPPHTSRSFRDPGDPAALTAGGAHLVGHLLHDEDVRVVLRGLEDDAAVGQVSEATRSRRASTSERRTAGRAAAALDAVQVAALLPGGISSRSTPQYWQISVATPLA